MEYRGDTFFMIAEIWGFLHLLSSTAAVVKASCFESVPSNGLYKDRGGDPCNLLGCRGEECEQESHSRETVLLGLCLVSSENTRDILQRCRSREICAFSSNILLISNSRLEPVSATWNLRFSLWQKITLGLVGGFFGYITPRGEGHLFLKGFI